MVWIGDRTRQFDHAHGEYMRESEIQLASMSASWNLDDLKRLIGAVNPDNIPGRLCCTADGADRIFIQTAANC